MNAIASLKIFLFSFFVLCLLSCRPGFDLVHLQAPPAQKEQLPRLVLEMGGSSFANLYPLPREIREQDMESGEISYRLDFKDQIRYQDVKTIFERTLNHSICEPRGPYFGTARLKVSSHSVMHRAQGLILLSVLSAFTLNALGMPGAKVEAVVEYELEILDSEGHRINSYIGQGFAKRWIGFYYGNGAPERMVHTEAV